MKLELRAIELTLRWCSKITRAILAEVPVKEIGNHSRERKIV